ncbi:MAG: hypothetical protein GXO88_12120 [Chlorobi bacterium]|nr:hypothetical protein [Chlorobiota bacterium]
MHKILISLIVSLFCLGGLRAQTSFDNYTGTQIAWQMNQVPEDFELLPSKMIFTQRLLWGRKGLMRNFNRFGLTPEKRKNELKVRRTMLKTHQIMGFVTIASMLSQVIVGERLYDGETGLKDTHEFLAGLTNITYITTASLSLFAPPKMIDEPKGYSKLKVHRILAIVHISGMIATNILAGLVEDNPGLRPYHAAAAITTFASFTAAMIVIKL